MKTQENSLSVFVIKEAEDKSKSDGTEEFSVEWALHDRGSYCDQDKCAFCPSGFSLVCRQWTLRTLACKVRLLARMLEIFQIPDRSLGTLAHFSNICQENLSLHPLPPNSMLFIVTKLSLLVSNIVGGNGFLIPVMPLVVFKIAC